MRTVSTQTPLESLPISTSVEEIRDDVMVTVEENGTVAIIGNETWYIHTKKSSWFYEFNKKNFYRFTAECNQKLSSGKHTWTCSGNNLPELQFRRVSGAFTPEINLNFRIPEPGSGKFTWTFLVFFRHIKHLELLDNKWAQTEKSMLSFDLNLCFYNSTAQQNVKFYAVNLLKNVSCFQGPHFKIIAKFASEQKEPLTC